MEFSREMKRREHSPQTYAVLQLTRMNAGSVFLTEAEYQAWEPARRARFLENGNKVFIRDPEAQTGWSEVKEPFEATINRFLERIIPIGEDGLILPMGHAATRACENSGQ